MFRGVAASIPQILRGDAVINGDELVPFFNPTSQLIDQAAGKFNQLTNGYEFRVRYSFLTTWMRYYKILPFAIIIVIPSVAYAAYLAVSWMLAASLPGVIAALVYLIGRARGRDVPDPGLRQDHALLHPDPGLQPLHGLLGIDHVRADLCRRRALSAHRGGLLITLFNPAVHYLILFALYMGMTVLTLMVMEIIAFLRGGGLRRLQRPPWPQAGQQSPGRA